MDNREKLYSGLSKAAWGYFLLNFDINLGTVSTAVLGRSGEGIRWMPFQMDVRQKWRRL